jgi:putative hydrolase of the HAD superfamily
MKKIAVVSFDLEGTLVTFDFSLAVWHEEIPRLYAQKHKLRLEEARVRVEEHYDEVGDQRMEWYDVSYWFERFGLGDYREAVERCKSLVSCYPEVPEVLESLGRQYVLIVTSSSTRDFIPHLLDGMEHHFSRVFSSTSDYRQLKTPFFYSDVCLRMGVAPSQVAHVGDSRQFDFDVPSRLGIRAFHLDRAGCHSGGNVVSSLAQLGELLGRS